MTRIFNPITDTDTNKFLNALGFNLSDGVLTGTMNDSSTVTVDLDGRYQEQEAGKGLSANDFTDGLETKLNGIETGAEVNVQSDWDAGSGDAQILNKPNVQYTSAIPNATASVTGLATSTQITKLDGIETGADVTDATNVNAAGATMNADTDVSSNSWVLDEDDMASDSATKVPTQQSVKAYVASSGGTGYLNTYTQNDSQHIATEKIIARDADGLKLFEDGGTGIFIKNGGDVGIGTTTPGEKLEVNGTVKASEFKGATSSDTIINTDGASQWIILKQDDNEIARFGGVVAGGSFIPFMTFGGSQGADYYTFRVNGGVHLKGSLTFMDTGGSGVTAAIGMSGTGYAFHNPTGSGGTQYSLFYAGTNLSTDIRSGKETGSVNLNASDGTLGYHIGNVGLGCRDPLFQTDVESGSSTTTKPALNIKQSRDAGSQQARLSIGCGTVDGSGNPQEGFQLGTDYSANNTEDFFIYDSNDSALRLIIDTSGNVGIGASTPADKLNVAGNISMSGTWSTGATRRISARDNDTTKSLIWSYNNDPGTNIIDNNSVSVTVNGNEMLQMKDGARTAIGHHSYSYDNNYITEGAVTIGNYDQDYGGTSTGGWNSNMAAIMLECLNSTQIAVHDADTRVASFMRYKDNTFFMGGTMGWGTSMFVFGSDTATSGYAIEAHSDVLAMSASSEGTYLGLFKGLGSLPGYSSNRYPTIKTDFGCLYFAANNVYTGYICYHTGFVDVSDRRKKKNIKTIEGGLDKINKLRGVTFEWKDGRDDYATHIGVVAQEVQEVLPELVSDPTGTDMGVNYGLISSVCIEAIKELTKRVEKLEAVAA